MITGSLTDVNAALAAITYTPTGEYEGTDTVHFTALSTEEAAVGGNVSPTATPITATIKVNPVADIPVVTASAAPIVEDGTSALTLTLTECGRPVREQRRQRHDNGHAQSRRNASRYRRHQQP